MSLVQSNWAEIKSKILFSYMGCDWTSITVENANGKEVKKFLDNHVRLKKDRTIFQFENASTEVFFYTKSDQHFDFDPKTITTMEQWERFLVLFKEMSKKLNRDILFRPEDDYEDDPPLVRISGDHITYNYNVIEGYRDADNLFEEGEQ